MVISTWLSKATIALGMASWDRDRSENDQLLFGEVS